MIKMAIDTESKRRGVINMPPFTVVPVADGTVGGADRMQVSGWYSGILAQSPAGGNAAVFGREDGNDGFLFGGQVIR